MPPEIVYDDASQDNRADFLRTELKLWEKAFADANGGRKAERADIKKDPAICGHLFPECDYACADFEPSSPEI